MNTTSNRRSTAAFALGWAGLAALFALAAAGCSDHGPVYLFGPELFRASSNPPDVVFYSAAYVSFTTQAPQGGCNVCYSGPPSVLNGEELVVTVANTGGSGTYGPIQVKFSSGDCHVVWDYTSTAGANGTWVLPPSGSQNYATAIGTFGAGDEILPFQQTAVLLYQGADINNGDLWDETQAFSAAFYYTPNGSYSNQTIPVSINVAVTDGLGKVYPSSFEIYVLQSSGLGAGTGTTACPTAPNW